MVRVLLSTLSIFLFGAATCSSNLSCDREATRKSSSPIPGSMVASTVRPLTAGAIVAAFSLSQDRRLRSGKLAAGNQLFAPLETTERMLFGVAAAGFAGLLLSVVSGFAFVEDLFAQHLVHKTTLSLLALLLFGILLGGRLFAGWRGKRAVYLYLWGFGFLCLAYFGSRYVLEEILHRSWS